jgi:hypothetical protein
MSKKNLTSGLGVTALGGTIVLLRLAILTPWRRIATHVLS